MLTDEQVKIIKQLAYNCVSAATTGSGYFRFMAAENAKRDMEIYLESLREKKDD